MGTNCPRQTYPVCVDLWSNQPRFIVLLGLSWSIWVLCMKCVESWKSWTRCWRKISGSSGEDWVDLMASNDHPTERLYESWCYQIIQNISRMTGWHVKISHATFFEWFSSADLVKLHRRALGHSLWIPGLSIARHLNGLNVSRLKRNEGLSSSRCRASSGSRWLRRCPTGAWSHLGFWARSRGALPVVGGSLKARTPVPGTATCASKCKDGAEYRMSRSIFRGSVQVISEMEWRSFV